ncbi:heavy metal-responsive transcriptional regulator [Mycobacterium heckeshornense]|uniref:Hg(II)-responsive transcriptional regulator n=1 Tax=Mycobacterium heckeshornense TaxID=110505 RepID=A0A2G8BF97_9MYCO|nr:heavy metal-responsive transcriptional regulator [Mycobacterium heckeshornense]MCV7032937.1 heavy metal-responsive transcriptional regulator [Mycobacterium heckeshornense]PIJ36425.1 heavy metal-responsive transcriptional regulator [Mycobacterium heckeshornense]BCO33949.1 Hg(II)-responsive transcriptional regulator [Mycobacterium heckeshornense]BCQ07000.1 mercuric resistance operon regulatory protein [Mycobacterium heckeshornense]
MKTSEVAAQARVNTQTLRYYERRGLLPEPERTQSGYRVYRPDAVRVVRFVKRAQQLGFSLADIEELLHLADGGPDACEDAQAMASGRIAELQHRIDELTAMRDALAQLVDSCRQPRVKRNCPLLHAIESAAGTSTGNQESQ